MRNEYDISFYEAPDIGFVKVDGPEFCHDDLYELLGKNEYMATFNFIENSESYLRYGESITGTILYSPTERRNMENNKTEKLNGENIKVLAFMHNLSNKDREELKYGGFPLSDIQFVTFTPYVPPAKQHESGEKIVPNIIEIPLENADLLDADRIYQSYIADKINSKTKLIPFESEKFLGITLALNKGKIDSRIIKHLGFPVRDLQENLTVYYYWYKTLERRNELAEHHQQSFKDIKLNRFVTRITRMLEEFKLGGIDTKHIEQSEDFWRELVDLIVKFEPSVLLHSVHQIWWDFDTYIHILLRHVKEWQVSNFKDKSSFPYKFNELQRLIEKVLKEIEEEIESHFENHPSKEFKRVGNMAVLFNKDYYNIQIDKQGRLVNIYVSASF